MNLDNYKNFSTVGDLLKFIEKNNIPKDAKILFQRVEDFYFETHNWETKNKPGESYHKALEINKLIDSGEFNNEDNFPDVKDPESYRYSEEQLEQLKEKYIPCWCPVKYPGDDHLYLDAHY